MIHALQTIRLEHYNIHSVLACLRYLVREIEQGTWRPGFDVLYAVIDYIETFPEALHHPKEETWLFARLIERSPESAALTEKLCEEHTRGYQHTVELREALDAYRESADAFGRFRDTVAAFVDFQRHHMHVEESELLPLAQKMLTEDDWREIDAAFAENDDPVFGKARDERFRNLFRQIIDIAPTPMGFGDHRGSAR